MSRFSKVERSMWRDAKFRGLSAPPPNAQTLWQYLLTGPQNTVIPGLFVLGMATIAEEFGWEVADVRRCFDEILESGMARFDATTRLVWLPNALRHNTPANPNVVVGWRDEWALLPDCHLKRVAADHLAVQLSALSKEFARSFLIAQGRANPRTSSNPSGKRKHAKAEETQGPKGSVKGSPKQEQEQEQEQEGGESAPPPEPKTDERPASTHPEDALAAMSRGSSGRLQAFGATDLMRQLGAIARDAKPRPLTVADFDLLGRAFVAKTALAWCRTPPSLGQLLRNGGEHLLGGIQEALAWDAKQRAADAERVAREAAVHEPQLDMHPRFAAILARQAAEKGAEAPAAGDPTPGDWNPLAYRREASNE